MREEFFFYFGKPDLDGPFPKLTQFTIFDSEKNGQNEVKIQLFRVHSTKPYAESDSWVHFFIPPTWNNRDLIFSAAITHNLVF